MEIQLEFENADEISLLTRDRIRVDFNDETFFRGYDNQVPSQEFMD